MKAAVILGAAVNSDGTPSPTLRRRTMHAIALFKSGAVTHVICSGGLGRFPPTEASVMSRLCREEGLPDAAILLEDQSCSTLENLEKARPILVDLGISEIIIVTDHYHKWRAAMTARHLEITARVNCPAPTGTPKHKLLKSWLRELPGLAYYWWRLRRLTS